MSTTTFDPTSVDLYDLADGPGNPHHTRRVDEWEETLGFVTDDWSTGGLRAALRPGRGDAARSRTQRRRWPRRKSQPKREDLSWCG